MLQLPVPSIPQPWLKWEQVNAAAIGFYQCWNKLTHEIQDCQLSLNEPRVFQASEIHLQDAQSTVKNSVIDSTDQCHWHYRNIRNVVFSQSRTRRQRLKESSDGLVVDFGPSFPGLEIPLPAIVGTLLNVLWQWIVVTSGCIDDLLRQTVLPLWMNCVKKKVDLFLKTNRRNNLLPGFNPYSLAIVQFSDGKSIDWTSSQLDFVDGIP